MSETYRVLGQLNPVDGGEYVLYNSNTSGQGTIVTNITVANLSPASQNFNINIYNSLVNNSDLLISGASLVNNLYYQVSVAGFSSIVLEPGITLAPNNTISAVGNTNLTFSVYGVELI